MSHIETMLAQTETSDFFKPEKNKAGQGLKVVEDLNVDITGTGSVYYRGNPSINLTISGTGSLINDN